MVFPVSTSNPTPESEITARFLRRARQKDTAARGIIMAGGIGIIAAVVGIFVLIVGVAIPLFREASVERAAVQLRFPQPETLLAADMDDYGENFYSLHRDGTVLGLGVDGKAL